MHHRRRKRALHRDISGSEMLSSIMLATCIVPMVFILKRQLFHSFVGVCRGSVSEHSVTFSVKKVMETYLKATSFFIINAVRTSVYKA
ncbi:hypothetical protein E5288_WYG013086 [Bos mutus]|uniref:Uncharacterized protein n=1 Tax=Bos mutus TaxID=72004 RepID=A0A6B0RBE8_9CETA|nr:hypothetical protein [Bos mutus]